MVEEGPPDKCAGPCHRHAYTPVITHAVSVTQEFNNWPTSYSYSVKTSQEVLSVAFTRLMHNLVSDKYCEISFEWWGAVVLADLGGVLRVPWNPLFVRMPKFSYILIWCTLEQATHNNHSMTTNLTPTSCKAFWIGNIQRLTSCYSFCQLRGTL